MICYCINMHSIHGLRLHLVRVMKISPEHQDERPLQGEMVLRTITVPGGRTTMRLELEFWNAVDDVCQREGISTDELVRRAQGNLRRAGRTRAVRVYLMSYFRGWALGPG